MGKPKTNYQNGYIKRTYDRFEVLLPKGEKDELKAHIAQYGSGITASVNGYVIKAIKEAMERDISTRSNYIPPVKSG